MPGKVRQTRQSAAQVRRARARQVQTRRLVLAVSVLSLAVILTAVGSYSTRAEAAPESTDPEPVTTSATADDPALPLVSATYTAELAGDFGADGPHARLVLSYDAESDTVSYALEIISALANPSTAVLRLDSPGQYGSTVFTMFEGPVIAGRFSGMLAQGEITASDLAGPLQGARVADLASLLRDGEVYASVGTTGVPIDAIRGQIE